MKTIKTAITIFLFLPFFVACSTEEVIYDGQQVCQLKLEDNVVFSEKGQDNARNLEVWLLKPAENDITVPVRIAKSTRPGSLYINGQTYAAGDEFTVMIPKGALKTEVAITTGKDYYNINTDTLLFELPDPNLGRTESPVYMNNKAALYYLSYCPATQSDLQEMKGTYNDMDINGLTFEVTQVIGDTLVIDGLYNALPYMTGMNPIEGYPLKFVVNRNAKPMTVTVAGDQPFFITTISTGHDETIWARNTNSTGEALNGSLNFCEKEMELVIPRFIPGQSAQPAWLIYVKKQ